MKTIRSSVGKGLDFPLQALLFILILVAPNVAQAASLGGSLTVGESRFYGNLSEAQRAPTHGFGLSYECAPLKPESAFGELAMGIGIDAIFLSVANDQNVFPYQNGASLNIVNFLLLPSGCMATGYSAQICAGIGLGTVNVNSHQNRQDYGSWHYEIALKTNLSKAWNAGLFSKYVGKVEQRVNGVDSEFGFLLYGFRLSYLTWQ